jgi:hypothetical protein
MTTKNKLPANHPQPKSVKPALTPEEWATKPYIAGWDDGSVFPVCPSWPWITADSDVERPHAVAAIALHGQPFGFSREDVDALRAFDWDFKWNDSKSVEVARAEVERLRVVLAKIEALLPPMGAP